MGGAQIWLSTHYNSIVESIVHVSFLFDFILYRKTAFDLAQANVGSKSVVEVVRLKNWPRFEIW